METTKRKRGRLDRAVPILLAAAMALQISAGSLMAHAANAAAPDGTGTNTVQGDPASGGPAPQTRAAEDNLLTGDGVRFNQGSGTVEDGTAATTITGEGADWSTMLACPANFEAGYAYKVQATLTTTKARTITISSPARWRGRRPSRSPPARGTTTPRSSSRCPTARSWTMSP